MARIVSEPRVAWLHSSAPVLSHRISVLFSCLLFAVSVLDPVFLARRRVSQASQQSMEADQARDKGAGQIG